MVLKANIFCIVNPKTNRSINFLYFAIKPYCFFFQCSLIKVSINFSSVQLVILFSVLPLSFDSICNWFTDASVTFMDEICDNALDDDADGLVDLNDPDCSCQVVEPISLIPNPSFEELECCPSDRSQLYCATGWVQASEPTTDLIHSCDWLGWNGLPPPQPFPDGQGIMGFRDGRVRQNGFNQTNWKEYAGACLLGPLEKDTTYRFEFHVGFITQQISPPINISVYGSADCDAIPFGNGDEDFGCPTNGSGWVLLGSVLVSGNGQHTWVKSGLEFVPNEDINAIAIGPACPAVQTTTSLFYFFDNLVVNNFKFFELEISEVSHPCENDFTLSVRNNPDYDFQWYQDGIALVGERSFRLQNNYGEGDYQVRILDGASCRVSGFYSVEVPKFSSTVFRMLCADESLEFGDITISQEGTYLDTFSNVNNCDSIVSLVVEKIGEIADTIQVDVFEGESYQIGNEAIKKEGDNFVTLTSAGGCDSLVLVQLDFFNVYFPNVFSPNNDGLNDLFQLYAEDGLVRSSELSIYSRWGALIYRGSAWNGRNAKEIINPGVYLYSAKVIMHDGLEKQFHGSVTLLK